MPNAITATGLTTATLAELVANYTANYQAIYGSSINLATNTPDGQMMMVFLQSVIDLEDLITNVNAMFDPDQAIGTILDQRVAINGVVRQGGTYSITNVSITIVLPPGVGTVILSGLDQTTLPVFTVADSAGTQWELITSITYSANGVYSLAFQAATPGAVLSSIGAITNPVTVVLGVSLINNPSAPTVTGVNEETDAALKIRRSISVSLPSQGFYAGLKAALLNLNGVSGAFIYENDTNAPDSDSTPAHTIWVIVGGTASAASIANAIYTKRAACGGMRGNTSYTITRPDGSTFVIYWDTVVTQNVFTQMTLTSLDGINAPNIAAIQAGLLAKYIPGVYQEINVNALATYVQQIDPNSLVTNAGFAVATTQAITYNGVPTTGSFAITYNGSTSALINGFDIFSTAAAKMNAVSGLANVVITGNTTSGFVFTFPFGTAVLGFIGYTTNTLMTAAPAAVTITVTPTTYTPVLVPSSKRSQFVFTAATTVITPITLSAALGFVGVVSGVVVSTVTVTHATTKQFTPLGGYAPFTYSMQTSGSGSPTVSTAGLYTAGATAGIDVVKVTDALGNTAISTVTVV